MFFKIEFSLTIASYKLKKKMYFHKSWLYFSGKIFSTTLRFQILKISKKSSNIVIKKNVPFEKILLKIPVIENYLRNCEQ